MSHLRGETAGSQCGGTEPEKPEHYSINSYDPEFQPRDSVGGMTIVISNGEPPALEPGQY